MADPFQPKFVDLVRNTTTTIGTGNFTLGAAVTGFTSFTAACQVGDSFYYSAIGIDKPAEREVGRGTLQANGTISRDPIAGSRTNFSSGTKSIALIAAAEWYGAAQQLMANASRVPAVVADRTALAGYSATTTAYLREAGREGMFVWDGSDRSAAVAADTRQGIVIAATGDPTGTSGAWVRRFAGPVSVKWFGAAGDGSANDGPAFIGALAFLRAYALNSGGGAYKGSPKLFIPAGHYYLGTTTLDINHTVMIEGEGSGRAPAPGYGCSRLRWDDGVCGIRIQFPGTSGTSLVDSGQDGSGSVYIRNLSLQGAYSGTNGASHAIVVRAITFLDDILIRNWSGTGVLSWTGNVNGAAYSGNTSVSRYTGVKVEGCKVAFDTRGTDSNVITLTNCEAYQCRQAGFIDDNGAGSNTYIGCHATYNGLIGGSGVVTQVSYAGKYYSVRWGQDAWCAANAPSGSTADNSGWVYFGAGAPDASRPAWTNGITGLAAGGDYVMLSAYPTVLISCYVEGGGFSQLSTGTLTVGGTNLGISSVGGSCLVPEYDGLALKRLHSAAILHLDGVDGGANGIDSRDSSGLVGGIQWNNQASYYFAGAPSGHRFHTVSAGVPTYCGTWGGAGISLNSGQTIAINNVQVVGARQSGTPADASDLATAITLVNSLKAKLMAHGLIS